MELAGFEQGIGSRYNPPCLQWAQMYCMWDRLISILDWLYGRWISVVFDCSLKMFFFKEEKQSCFRFFGIFVPWLMCRGYYMYIYMKECNISKKRAEEKKRKKMTCLSALFGVFPTALQLLGAAQRVLQPLWFAFTVKFNKPKPAATTVRQSSSFSHS